MKKENIYIGTINKCLNSYAYSIYGSEQVVDDFQKNQTTYSHIEEYAMKYREQVVLIKTKKGYIDLEMFENLLDELKFKLNISDCFIQENPSENGELFVDKKSLVPYATELKDNVSIKQLKKYRLLDPRIKGGIEH